MSIPFVDVCSYSSGYVRSRQICTSMVAMGSFPALVVGFEISRPILCFELAVLVGFKVCKEWFEDREMTRAVACGEQAQS